MNNKKLITPNTSRKAHYHQLKNAHLVLVIKLKLVLDYARNHLLAPLVLLALNQKHKFVLNQKLAHQHLRCPEPKACPVLEKTKCAEIKYIKVPTIITRTIKVDNDNKVISEEVQEEKSEPTKAPVKSPVPPPVINEPVVTVPTNTRKANAQKKCGVVGLNSDFKKFGIYGYE